MVDERTKSGDAMNVSIIMPIYNVSNYIERCVNSVIAQTFQGSLECILVDDVSPDDSIAKCEKILESYKGPIEFRIIHHEVNKGLSGARNTGTKAAKGDYLYYLDSDDELTPNCIDVLYKQVKEHGDVQMVLGQTKAIPHKAYYEIDSFKKLQYVKGNSLIRALFYNAKKNIPVSAWNKLVRRDFLEQYNLYFREGIIHEDHHWIRFVIKYLNSIAFVFEDTYIHYSTPNSIMTSLKINKSYEHYGIILLDLVKNLDSPYMDLQIYQALGDFVARFDKMRSNPIYENLGELLISQMMKCKFIFMAALFLLYKNNHYTPNGFPFGIFLRKYCRARYRISSRRCLRKNNLYYDKKHNCFEMIGNVIR